MAQKNRRERETDEHHHIKGGIKRSESLVVEMHDWLKNEKTDEGADWSLPNARLTRVWNMRKKTTAFLEGQEGRGSIGTKAE